VIDAELQAALNTVREHDFQGAFKNGRSIGNGAYVRNGATSRVMVASRLKVSDQMAAPVPDMMHTSSIYQYGLYYMFHLNTY
jgi:hypothetical protein